MPNDIGINYLHVGFVNGNVIFNDFMGSTWVTLILWLVILTNRNVTCVQQNKKT